MKEFYFLLYVLIINIYTFCLTGIDKYKARKEKWRVNEKNFFITALLGGAAGVMMGMVMFRHKTKHKTFYIGIPVIYIINMICVSLLIFFIYVK
ncbi:DUF1294 domain-containing protein [Crassaminicella thermophila]|uniref:DUF1294 domain-containing protein n=2 Tax=Crassaminicella thermophila TaxID=2599308 RepID=A0A5C0SIT0_CRATE|nr:DUF1294 domain-containing protein [Crassaminicella thermophila]